MATAAAPSASFGRARPAFAFSFAVAFIAAHHWWVVTQQEMYPKFLLFLFMTAGWAVGGIVYPPAFYALTKWGSHLPRSMKIMGAVFGIAGLALGMYAMGALYERTF